MSSNFHQFRLMNQCLNCGTKPNILKSYEYQTRTCIKACRSLISGTFQTADIVELIGPEKTIALLKTIQNILMTLLDGSQVSGRCPLGYLFIKCHIKDELASMQYFNAHVCEWNATSDWVKSNICDSKSYDILSENWRHYVTSLFIVWCLVLRCWQRLLLVQACGVLKGNEEKCIIMGITVVKMVLWGGKSSVLWSHIAFYIDDLPPQMTTWKAVCHLIF